MRPRLFAFALGAVLCASYAQSASAAFVDVTPYTGGDVSSPVRPMSSTGFLYNGTDGFSTLIGTATYSYPYFFDFDLVWKMPNATNSICFGQGGCITGSEIGSPDESYYVSLLEKGNGSTTVTLASGANPFTFAVTDLVPAPLPPALPMFGAALFGLGLVGYSMRRKQSAAIEALAARYDAGGAA